MSDCPQETHLHVEATEPENKTLQVTANRLRVDYGHGFPVKGLVKSEYRSDVLLFRLAGHKFQGGIYAGWGWDQSLEEKPHQTAQGSHHDESSASYPNRQVEVSSNKDVFHSMSSCDVGSSTGVRLSGWYVNGVCDGGILKSSMLILPILAICSVLIGPLGIGLDGLWEQGVTVAMIPIPWNVPVPSIVERLWSTLSATNSIWLSCRVLGKSFPSATAAFRSNWMTSLYAHENPYLWSVFINNFDAKWRCICMPRPSWSGVSNF